MAEKTRKFFDKNWQEVTPELADFAVELEHNKDGLILSSTVYKVKETGSNGMKALYHICASLSSGLKHV